MLSFFFNQVFWSWLHVSSVRLCTIISHPVILCLLKLSKWFSAQGDKHLCPRKHRWPSHLYWPFFAPRTSLSLSHFLLLSTDFFALSSFLCVSLILCDHASAFMCVRESVCVCVYGRLCSQVAYEFHLSAARGALLRISPNGLVCNCSVNTCLSRQWRAEGKRPLTLWTEATYWAANSYLPPDRKGERRPQLR